VSRIPGLPTGNAPVPMTVTVSRETYASLCAQAGSFGISAATHAARILEAHERALHAETRRVPGDFRLDA